MKKRGVQFLIIFLAACFLAASCASPPDNSAGSASEYRVEDDHITLQLSDKLIVDAEILAPDVEEAQVLHVVRKPLVDNWKDIAAELMQDDNLVFREPEEAFGAAQASSQDNRKALTCAYGGFLLYNDYTLTDKPYRSFRSQWVLSGTRPTFPTPFAMYEESITVTPAADLPGFPVNEASDRVRSVCDSFGIPLEDTPHQIKVFDAATLEELRAENNSYCSSESDPHYMKDTFLEEDAYYILHWYYEYEGIPFLPNYNLSGGHVVGRGYEGPETGTAFVAYVRKDGIPYMLNDATASYTILEKEEPGKLVSAEEAVERLPKYLEKVILEEQRTVTALRLCYVPVLTSSYPDDPERDTFDLIPCWVGETYYEREGSRWWEISYMNAITGEFLPVD